MFTSTSYVINAAPLVSSSTNTWPYTCMGLENVRIRGATMASIGEHQMQQGNERECLKGSAYGMSCN